MPNDEGEVRVVYLQPGEICLERDPAILKTLLGSCVGVTFWSQRLGMGALCHGILPRSPMDVQSSERFRYVDFAIRYLARQFEDFGIHRTDLHIKVFGGADVLEGYAPSSIRMTIGQQNVQAAIETLRDANLTVIASDLGGRVGRTIQFDTRNGEVLVRRLSRMPTGEVSHPLTATRSTQ